MIGKARDLCEPIVGKSQVNALIEKVFALEKLRSVRDLRSVLQKA